MVNLPSILILTLSLLAGTQARPSTTLSPRDGGDQLKVQYYSDLGCSEYLIEVNNPPNGFNGNDQQPTSPCYDYAYTDTQSANIAWAYTPSTSNVYCVFYSGKGCNVDNQVGSAVWMQDNCVQSNNIGSFTCTY